MARNVTSMLYAFAGLLSVGGAIITTKKFERDVSLDGQIDTTNILRTTNDTSEMRCARNCNSEPNCVAFFINPNTKTCQEQSALSSTDLEEVTSSPGYRYYRSCVLQVIPHTAALFECPVNNGDWTTGYLPDGTYLFKLFADQMVNHTTAFGICQSIGANLPKIYEVDKMNFYLNNIFTCSALSMLGFWIDGTNINAPDKTSPDAWTTHDGIVIPKIPELWYTSRPNNPNTENCIYSRYASFGFKFDDGLCGNQMYQVLCEKKISC